jgi:hypothetical protein
MTPGVVPAIFLAHRVAVGSCQTNTATTVAICFTSSAWTRSSTSMFEWCVRELYS